MTLDEVLNMFRDATEAAQIARTGRTSAWHWYQSGSRRKIPSCSVLVLWAEHFSMSDADLGELIRDAELKRVELQEMVSSERGIVPPRRSELRRQLEAEIAAEHSKILEMERNRELEQNEEYWENKRKHFEEVEKRARLDDLRNKLKELSNGNH